MTATDEPRPLTELVDAGSILMLMTMIDGTHSSRPLTCAGIDGDRISFLVDGTSSWVGAIEGGAGDVHLTMADNRGNDYVAVNGDARLSRERADIDELWSAPAGAYFDGGKDDPNIVVVHVDVREGEYWSSPSGRLGAALSLIRVATSNDPDKAGDHGPIS